MKLGIITKIDSLDKILPGDKMNYMKFIADYFRQKNDLVLINWRDIDSDLNVSKHLKCTREGTSLTKETSSLNELCNVLFIKNLGKIHFEKQAFLDFLSSLDNFNGKIINPLQTIKNNLSKQYLLDFQKKGFPIIPTLEVKNSLTLKDLKKIDFSNEHYNQKPKDIVVKPKVFGEQGFAVKEISSFNNEQEFEEYKNKHSPLLAQPKIEEIFEKGENSFIFLGEEFVHSVNKFTGEFKINCIEGIKCTVHEPTNEELRTCKKIIENWPDPIGYTRIDMIPFGNKFLISEIETVNPAFYIENVLSLKDNFVKELEKFLLKMNN